MGRIRDTTIRVITELILKKYPIESFSNDFYKNKQKLLSLPEEFPSKKILNRVAGSLTREYKKFIKEQKMLKSEN